MKKFDHPVANSLNPLLEIFAGQTALIFASGPSLTKLWSADRPLPLPSIAVADAWRIAPKADALYATDQKWWMHHKGVPEFQGVKIGYQGPGPAGIIWLSGSGREGYDERLGFIRHQWNSGGSSIHLAAQLGARRIVLIGFDFRVIDGRRHFFGEHPREIESISQSRYDSWAELMSELARELERRKVEVLNATPGSALKTWPFVDLEKICREPSSSSNQALSIAEMPSNAA
jgi:hypothetical protein